ncbi:MAG: threonine ammonia-lyase [Alphaproteobacteria bacterium]|jgi:threonine dehydratase|nr:threonine ammonia-lyase [Rhodospirillaceae bacterium]MDG2480402.1 threonine ammonia-lyase [Alphaproteobacteria bacterium]MBT6205693.1 threonine ammonia-lyase [Rhodospirillaceae bacterium]MBT6510077.1 threonine ammonia-lyase [Rhodospirillaceae bacterium]MBT7612295.1 threonine ammonia-lyase [Rhodospirillaceae bacterium]
MTVTIDDIRAAAELLDGQITKTPCTRSRTLSEMSGAEVYVKFENLQFTASFKDRGSLVKMASLIDEEQQRGVIAMSAGNHAQAVAYHAQRLGIPSTIVMPVGAPTVKVKNTRRFGARVVLSGETIDEAGIAARQIAADEDLVFVHPYDDPKVMAGQGTVGLEMMASVPDLDVIIVPIGGGGLIGGIATAAKAIKPEIEIIGVEAAMFPSMYQSLQGLTVKAGGRTIADGIAVKTPGKVNIPVIKELVSDIILVTEDQLEHAVQTYLEIEKTVAEGGGGAPLAALLAHPERFTGKKVGLVLTGGNIDSRILSAVIEHGLVRDGRMVQLRIEIPDAPGTLARISGIIGECDANIIEVYHQRAFSSLPVKLADLDVVLETLDRDHIADIMSKLTAAGFKVRQLESESPALVG